MKVKFPLWALALLVIGIPACTPSLDTYKENEIGMVQNVYTGTLIGVRDITIEPDNANTSTALGGVAGGLSGAMLGGGRASLATAAGGAIAGAFAGNQLEKAVRTEKGLQLEVKLDNKGGVKVVRQVADPNYSFYNGQRVKLYEGYKGSRVEPY